MSRDIPQKVRQQITVQKVMWTVPLRVNGPDIADLMIEQHSYNGQYFLSNTMEPSLRQWLQTAGNCISIIQIRTSTTGVFTAQMPLRRFRQKWDCFFVKFRNVWYWSGSETPRGPSHQNEKVIGDFSRKRQDLRSSPSVAPEGDRFSL
jgi:hypothetical protein